MSDVERGLSRILELYQNEVLPLRTRTVRLPGRKCQPALMKSFLGIEIKAGRKRITCPDLVTAQYLSIFVEIGRKETQIPYDPTKTSTLLPELESTFATLKSAILQRELSPARQKIEQRRIFARMRRALTRADEESAPVSS